ncbi:uncharacterized protein [Macrobrachium rosenbergii]|uniref:uncharacterized protein n=1 Tax=Macrobrachium rosenbergii TaxID=79674 RepID=UPI0034D684B2
MLKELACVSEVIRKVTLKRLCPTRWSSRHDSLVALRFRYSDVVKVLSKISPLSDSHNERDAAGGLLKKIEIFEFIILVVVQTKLLERINALSKALQSQELMLDKAIHLLKNSVDSLMEMRDSYAQVKEAAEKLSNKYGVEPKFQYKHIRKVKKHFDELCTDERFSDPEYNFKMDAFYGCFDILIIQLNQRFKGPVRASNHLSILVFLSSYLH